MLIATGTAALDEVWDRYARPERWPEWSPQIRAVEASADRIAAGVTGVVHGPVGTRIAFDVLAVDETARTWTWVPHVGPFAVVMTHAVLPTTGGTRTTLELSGPPVTRPALLAYAPLAQLALRRLVRP